MFKAMTFPDDNTGKPVSLSVPIVQELALQDPHAVPEKYVASEQDRPSVLSSTCESDSIPVIDMSILHDNPKELEKIALAAQEWGFFQVINHGIPGSLMERMRSVVKGFFQLPLDEKLKYEMQNNQGYGQAFVASEEQRLDWADILFLFTLPVESRDMNLWPTTPKNFRETMQDYALETKILAEKLLTALAQGLGIRSNCFVESFGEVHGSVRMNYYPPCPRPELVLGLSPHSDAVGITILLQDDKCPWEALQVRKGGEWVSIPSIPDALVINIGDHLEVVFQRTKSWSMCFWSDKSAVCFNKGHTKSRMSTVVLHGNCIWRSQGIFRSSFPVCSLNFIQTRRFGGLPPSLTDGLQIQRIYSPCQFGLNADSLMCTSD